MKTLEGRGDDTDVDVRGGATTSPLEGGDDDDGQLVQADRPFPAYLVQLLCCTLRAGRCCRQGNGGSLLIAHD
jgi:hypothetical protein